MFKLIGSDPGTVNRPSANPLDNCECIEFSFEFLEFLLFYRHIIPTIYLSRRGVT